MKLGPRGGCMAAWLLRPAALFGRSILVVPLRAGLYLWQLIVISAILQLGMLPALAYYFHRVTLIGPLANIPALLLTGLIVPLGLFTLVISLVSRGGAVWLRELFGFFFVMLR